MKRERALLMVLLSLLFPSLPPLPPSPSCVLSPSLSLAFFLGPLLLSSAQPQPATEPPASLAAPRQTSPFSLLP